jgi:peptidoglycan hydrolase CwlO-like protein
LALLPDFLAQQQSEVRESREPRIRVKSMNAARQPINCRLNALEAGQREVSVQHSAIEAELSEMRESANRTERELSELATEIGRVGSMSAIAREMLSLQANEADERLTRSERGSAGLSGEVEALRRRSDEVHEKIVAPKEDISKIKKDLEQLKDRVDQQPPALTPPAPALGFDSLTVPQYPPLFEEFRTKRFNLLL